MIGVQSYADKLAGAVERNRAALTRSERRLAEHDAAKPEGDDADAMFDWKRERRDLEDRVDSDREALAFSEAKAAEAAKAGALANLNKRAAAQERASAALADRVRRDWPKAAATIRGLLDALAADEREVRELARTMGAAGLACRIVPAVSQAHRIGRFGQPLEDTNVVDLQS